MIDILKGLRTTLRKMLQHPVEHANAAQTTRIERRIERLSDEVRYEAGLLKNLWFADREFDQIGDAGYGVYSQFDEDGIIQHLLRHVPIEQDLFIEFGVEDYRQSNTRFLLQKDVWRGVILDASDDALAFLHESGLYGWRDMTFIQSFITRENVDGLLAPFGNDIGLLSIDVDGVDYHLWEAIQSVSPRIVVIEYQPNFGPDLLLTVPYRHDFQRSRHHFSNLCAGASLPALHDLGARKGYTLVGTSRGPNAFFVRDDLLGTLRAVSPRDAWREPRYRDSLGPNCEPTYLTTLDERRRAMADAIVHDLRLGRDRTITDVFGLHP